MVLLRYIVGTVIFLLVVTSRTYSADLPIRYLALGDSYTVGTGVLSDEAWPALITKRLQEKGISIELIANLGRAGWTTQNLIDYELPVFNKLQPNFVTVLIGVNDWVQGVPSQVFQQHMTYILDELLKSLPPSRILVITIPDFSVTPTGQIYSNGRDIPKGISEFNQILTKEAKLRSLNVIDLYPLSQGMGRDSSLVNADDGLHPSPKEHKQWADLIEPAVEKAVK